MRRTAVAAGWLSIAALSIAACGSSSTAKPAAANRSASAKSGSSGAGVDVAAAGRGVRAHQRAAGGTSGGREVAYDAAVQPAARAAVGHQVRRPDRWLAVDLPTQIWTGVDVAGRMVLGSKPTTGEDEGFGPFQFLAQKDITFDPSHGWTGYPDFAQQFAKLWDPSA